MCCGSASSGVVICCSICSLGEALLSLSQPLLLLTVSAPPRAHRRSARTQQTRCRSSLLTFHQSVQCYSNCSVYVNLLSRACCLQMESIRCSAALGSSIDPSVTPRPYASCPGRTAGPRLCPLECSLRFQECLLFPDFLRPFANLMESLVELLPQVAVNGPRIAGAGE